MTKRRSFLVSVKSREQLLIEDKAHEPKSNVRRTKILASISDKTNNYEKIKNMFQAGANGFK